jgi:hypothetical protein
VALLGRGTDLSEGIRRVRNSKERARLRTALTRFQVEQLETRTLLATGPFLVPSQILPQDGAPPRAAISFEPSMTPSDGRDPAVLASLAQASSILEPVQLTDLTGNWSASLILVGPSVPVDLAVHDAGFERSPYAAFQSSGTSPFALSAPAAGAQVDWVGIGIVGLSGAGFLTARLSQPDVAEFGLGLAEIGMNDPFPGNHGGAIAGLTSLAGYHPLFEETFFTAKPFFTSEPVSFDLASDSYGLAFHAMGEPGPGTVPGLIAGGPMEGPGVPPGEIAAMIGMTASPAQALGLAARGMPNAAHLGAQLVSSGSQATTEAGTIAGSAALTWGVPVVVSAQRQDGQDPATSISEPTQGSGRILLSSLSALAGAPTSSDTEASVPTVVTDETGLSAPDQVVPAIEVTAETPSSASAGFIFRITAGPFVSRNAGPLGPILASVGGDPTPEVDRNERALHHEIERRDFDGSDYIHPGYDSDGSESGADDGNGASGPVMAISGPGGFQLKVTALSNRRRTDLSELISAIPRTAGREGELSIDSARMATAAEASSPDETPVYAKFIKAACVLALGVGMSSGVLFPNLLASIRRRIPRSFVHRKSHARKS